MITKLKSETARLNGARYRGPATPGGKLISSQNSIRHGMLSRTVVLEGESRDLFKQLHDALVAEIKPRPGLEAGIVEALAVAKWRQMRTWAVQKAGFDYEMSRPENSSGPFPTRFALTFKKLANKGRELDLINRYETSFDRQFSRAST